MERRQYEPASCLLPCSPAAEAERWRKSVWINMPVALMFLHTNTSRIQRGCICRDKQYRGAKIAPPNVGVGTRRRSWICSACISALHVSVTFSPPLGFADAVESLHFLLTPPPPHPPHALSLPLLREALFINQPRPNYTRLAPAPPPYRGSGGPKNTDADWR